METADSRTKRAIWAPIKKITRKWGRELPVFPNKVNNKWPAIIFAASRTAKVPGRITFLIVSIQTINGINTAGVPCGTKCANMCWVWLIHPYNIKDNQRGRARLKVKTKWLDLVNTYGNKPIKLLNKINENNEIKIKELPACPLVLNNVLNSLWSVNKILFQIIWYREGMNQNIGGIIKIPKNVLIQFNERLKMLVEGSKTENKFVIIFSLMVNYLFFVFVIFQE